MLPVEPAMLLAFVAAVTALVLSPGPDSLLILRYTMADILKPAPKKKAGDSETADDATAKPADAAAKPAGDGAPGSNTETPDKKEE